MSQAAVLLQESHAPSEEEEELARETLHDLSDSGMKVARLLRRRREQEQVSEASSGPPENGGRASA